MSSNASLPDAHGAGIVTGLRDVSGILPRRELDDLMTNDPDVFNLYILALDKLQKADVDDKMGYFRIAGRHGVHQRCHGQSSDNRLQGFMDFREAIGMVSRYQGPKAAAPTVLMDHTFSHHGTVRTWP